MRVDEEGMRLPATFSARHSLYGTLARSFVNIFKITNENAILRLHTCVNHPLIPILARALSSRLFPGEYETVRGPSSGRRPRVEAREAPSREGSEEGVSPSSGTGKNFEI